MNETTMVKHIMDAFELLEVTEQREPAIYDIGTYDEMSVMTNNSGLVVMMEDGAKFQITVNQVE